MNSDLVYHSFLQYVFFFGGGCCPSMRNQALLCYFLKVLISVINRINGELVICVLYYSYIHLLPLCSRISFCWIVMFAAIFHYLTCLVSFTLCMMCVKWLMNITFVSDKSCSYMTFIIMIYLFLVMYISCRKCNCFTCIVLFNRGP